MSKIFIITQTQDSNGDLFSEALVAFTTKEAAIRCIHNKRYQKELGLLPLDENGDRGERTSYDGYLEIYELDLNPTINQAIKSESNFVDPYPKKLITSKSNKDANDNSD